jgi:hypothetical protein
VPSCLFVRVVDEISFPSKSVLTVGLLGPFTVPDRAGRVPYCDLGVRDVALVGWW